MKHLAALLFVMFVMFGTIASFAQVQVTLVNKTPYPLQNLTVGATTTTLIRPGQNVVLSLPSLQLLDDSPYLEAKANVYDTTLQTQPAQTTGIVNLQTVFKGNYILELRIAQNAYGAEILQLVHINKPGHCGTIGSLKSTID